MTAAVRSSSSPARRRKPYFVQKPEGRLSERVQRVGPERFAVLSVDPAKTRSKYMLADFYGTVIVPPTFVAHERGQLQATVAQIHQALRDRDLRDLVVAIERTGEYHRPVQRATQQQQWDTRLVHPFTSKQFRLPADPNNKTDDTDLAAIHRAAVNGFGLQEPKLPPLYQRLQLLVRHRRDLVRKLTRTCNQLRETLHAAMPGYAECFSELWENRVALPLARLTGSAAVVRGLGVAGLKRLLDEHAPRLRYSRSSLTAIQAWAEQATEGHPHADILRRISVSLDDDRQRKTQEILGLERDSAALLAQTPYVLLLVIPGINVVSAAELAAEAGPMGNYPTANNLTGRAGMMPSRYQSDAVDLANGPLRRRGNRRLRAALMQIADNLVACNDYFRARAAAWKRAGKDARWIRVKVAKRFSRIAFAMVGGQRLFPHPCCQQQHYVLDKLLAFHREHDTPMSQVMIDLNQAIEQLPKAAHAAEAQPLRRLQQTQSRRRNGPQLLGDIIPIVLARLGVGRLQSTDREARDLS